MATIGVKSVPSAFSSGGQAPLSYWKSGSNQCRCTIAASWMYWLKNRRFGFVGVVDRVDVVVVVVVEDWARLRGARRVAPIEAATSSVAARFIGDSPQGKKIVEFGMNDLRETAPYSSDGGGESQGGCLGPTLEPVTFE